MMDHPTGSLVGWFFNARENKSILLKKSTFFLRSKPMEAKIQVPIRRDSLLFDSGLAIVGGAI